jgi:mRNA interferase MazF
MAMVKASKPKRFSVWGVDLDPTKGSEQAGYRPVVVLSPNELNTHLKTVIVAPMTTTVRGWPTRIGITHGDKSGEIALDQLRTVDKQRLTKAMGSLDAKHHRKILRVLSDIFAE